MLLKMEKRFGKYAIPNLTLYLIIGYIIGYMVQIIRPEMYEYLTFNPYHILQGQLWRVLTWILTTPQTLNIFTVIMLFLYYSLGKSLENTWGTCRYNAYIFSGIFFTVVGALVLYFGLVVFYSVSLSDTVYSMHIANVMGKYIAAFVSTYYINMSIFLAFSMTYPDMKLLLYFIIPIKIKWLGFLYGGLIVYDIVAAFINYSETPYVPLIKTAVILFSLLNFLIYRLSGQIHKMSQVKRKSRYKESVRQVQKANIYENGARHKCFVCGRTEQEHPDLVFRYCSKCSGGKEYCQDHLFTHTHS